MKINSLDMTKNLEPEDPRPEQGVSTSLPSNNALNLKWRFLVLLYAPAQRLPCFWNKLKRVRGDQHAFRTVSAETCSGVATEQCEHDRHWDPTSLRPTRRQRPLLLAPHTQALVIESKLRHLYLSDAKGSNNHPYGSPCKAPCACIHA